MNKAAIFLSVTIIMWVGLMITCMGLVGSIKDRSKTTYEKYQEHKDKETRLIIHNRILEDSVADLKIKAAILNNYLHAKHLEYIDVCNLVQRKSK
jgi:general stress protein CsbA